MNLIKTGQKKIASGTKTLSHAISLKSYRKLAINFLILTVNLAIIILYFTLSQATITIVPKKEVITHQATIPLTDIAGRAVATAVEAEKKFSVETGVSVPAVATGQVIIHNKTATRSQPLVATTRLAASDGVIIRLKDGITIKPGESKTVAAYADKAGQEGEVGPGQFEIVALKNDKDKIYGEVTAAFTGGLALSKALNQATLDKAKADLTAELKTLALAKLQESEPSLAENDVAVNITDFTPQAKVGDEVDSFTAQATAQATALVYDAKLARDFISKNLNDTLPPNKIVARLDVKSFQAAPTADGTALAASIMAYTQPKLPDAVFDKPAIIGMNRKEVETYFKKITGIADITVKFSPFWVRSVPNLQDHVDIEIKK